MPSAATTSLYNVWVIYTEALYFVVFDIIQLRTSKKFYICTVNCKLYPFRFFDNVFNFRCFPKAQSILILRMTCASTYHRNPYSKDGVLSIPYSLQYLLFG